MGVAIIVPDADFSSANLGVVTLLNVIPLESLEVVGPASVEGNSNAATYTVAYLPTLTTQRGIIWSIVSGSEYASINSSGVLSVLDGAVDNTVVIRATSFENPSIFDEMSVTVTYSAITSLYQLRDTVLDGATGINTNTPLTYAYASYTFLIDCTPTDLERSYATIYSEMNGEGTSWYGVVIRISGTQVADRLSYSIAVGSVKTGTNNNVISAGARIKFAAVVDAASNTVKLYDASGAIIRSTATSSSAWVTSSSHPTPMVGSDQGQTDRFFKGTIHKFAIYEGALTAEECVALLQ